MREPPTFQLISSSSCSTRGSRPVTHSTMMNHASHEMVRSMGRTQGEFGNAACSTLTPTRIATSAISTGITTSNAASEIHSRNSARAT